MPKSNLLPFHKYILEYLQDNGKMALWSLVSAIVYNSGNLKSLVYLDVMNLVNNGFINHNTKEDVVEISFSGMWQLYQYAWWFIKSLEE